MKNRRTLVMFAFALLLAGTVVHQYATDRFKKEAVDFYNFWAVPTAQKLSGYTLGSPYRAIPQYAEFLKDYLSRAPDDVMLFRATAFWYGHTEIRRVSRNNSPLLYTAFGIFPERYSSAASLFRWTEVGLFVAAVLLLAFLFGMRPLHATIIGMVLLLILFPAHRDLAFGNINAFLLFGLATVLTLCRFQRESLGPVRPALVGLLSSGLVLLTLLKPLVLVPCLLLALLSSFAGSFQDRVTMVSAGFATLLAGMAGPRLFFQSWTVWYDWLQAIKGDEVLLYPSHGENCSLVRLVADQAHIKPIIVTFVMGALLGLSLLLALSRRSQSFGGRTSHTKTLGWHACSLFNDAGLVVSIGVIFTLALSPLVWTHYYVLAIIPALWLWTHPTQSRVGLFLATTFVLAGSEPLVSITRATHTAQWYVLAQALSWIPLWTGILIFIGSTSPPLRVAGEQ